MYGAEDTTVSGAVYGYEVTGLTNGITYYFKVKATNAGEDSAASNEVSATPQAVFLPAIDEDEDEGDQNGGSDGNDDSNSDDSEPMPTEADSSSTGIDVLVNEQVVHATAVFTTDVNDQTVTTVEVNEARLAETLTDAGRSTLVSIPIHVKSDVVIGKLNGQSVHLMEQKQANLQIRTANAIDTIPAEQINIDAISEQFGQNVELINIQVEIEIAESTDDMKGIVENAAADGGFTITSPPLKFTVRGTYGEITIEVSRFNVYVER